MEIHDSAAVPRNQVKPDDSLLGRPYLHDLENRELNQLVEIRVPEFTVVIMHLFYPYVEIQQGTQTPTT